MDDAFVDFHKKHALFLHLFLFFSLLIMFLVLKLLNAPCLYVHILYPH